ncbi:MAG: NUDIX hydrolase [Caldilineaceae bacterium]|nr:NUDIX hydrolase [Caldilineaceae bacterium]
MAVLKPRASDAPEPATPADRRHPQFPMVGVGAVVFDLLDRVLLVQRGNPPHEEQWGLPGGLVELGENLHDALRRELREETAIEVRILDQIGVYEPIIRDRDQTVLYHYVVIDYLCRWQAGELTPGDDARAAAWVSAHNLERYGLAETAEGMIKAGRSRLVAIEAAKRGVGG